MPVRQERLLPLPISHVLDADDLTQYAKRGSLNGSQLVAEHTPISVAKEVGSLALQADEKNHIRKFVWSSAVAAGASPRETLYIHTCARAAAGHEVLDVLLTDERSPACGVAVGPH